MLSNQLRIIKEKLKVKRSLTSDERQLLEELDHLDKLLKQEHFPRNLLLDSVNFSENNKRGSSMITTSGSKCPCCGK